jgi:hypothetical protein
LNKFFSSFSNILTALITIPSYIILVLIMDIWGRYSTPYRTSVLKALYLQLCLYLRKPLFVLTMLVPGAACIVAAFLQVSASLLIMFL